MAGPAEKSENRGDSAVNRAVAEYVKTLAAEERMLVVLKAQLYGGSWEPMVEDLQNRLVGKPYIFKLANRIKDDVARIERMRKFEEEQGVDLSDFVGLDG